MARVTVEDCIVQIPNRFELVLLAAQRARNIGRGEDLTLERDNDKNPVVALREIADQTIPLDAIEADLIKSLQRAPEPEPARGAESSGMLVTQPVRSGQSVSFPGGDVTVVGSVASGAEVIAGGSIHVYGTLRGRAIAGVLGPGNGGGTGARIFCRRFEAELLAIDGVYKTADEMDPSLQGRAVQAFLDGEALAIAPLSSYR